MLDDYKELESQYSHEGYMVAKERFRNFIFRYRLINKVQKLRELKKESYEFTKASLEIQHLLKEDSATLVEEHIQGMKCKVKE